MARTPRNAKTNVYAPEKMGRSIHNDIDYKYREKFPELSIEIIFNR